MKSQMTTTNVNSLSVTNKLNMSSDIFQSVGISSATIGYISHIHKSCRIRDIVGAAVYPVPPYIM